MLEKIPVRGTYFGTTTVMSAVRMLERSLRDLGRLDDRLRIEIRGIRSIDPQNLELDVRLTMTEISRRKPRV